MKKRFERVPLTAAETDLSLSNFLRKVRPLKMILLIFSLPTLLLLSVMLQHHVAVNFITEISKIAAFIVLINVIQFLISVIEIKLGFKKVGYVEVRAKANLFLFKFLILRNFFPLILKPQNSVFDGLRKGDLIILEKTALNRLIEWRTI